MSKDLYDFVGDRIIEFCDKTYYGYIIFSFEQSYDGKEWTKEVEFASFYNGTHLCYESDWNEGQTHLRNLRIWHLEDSEPVVRCKDCKHRPIPNGINHPLAPKLDGWSDYVCPCLCDDEYYNFMPEDNDYCSRGERREDAGSDTDTHDF